MRLVCLLAVIGSIAAACGRQLLWSSSSTAAPPVAVARHADRLSNMVWPADGQAAVRLGSSRIHVGPRQHPAAIASVAKVMTAYLVLRDHPLGLGEDGPTITLTDADVVDTDRHHGLLLSPPPARS